MRAEPLVTAVADVVASREHPDQARLLATVTDAAEAVNAEVAAVQPWQVTVGDELQAAFDAIPSAVESQVRLRLRLLDAEPEPIDLRVGLGVGEVVASREEGSPFGQSGEGWWNARGALEEIRDIASAPHWPASRRTACRGHDDPALAAMLLGLDEILARMDATDRAVLTGLLHGQRQVDMAERLGISQPAVARRSRERGPAAVYRMLDLLRTGHTGGDHTGMDHPDAGHPDAGHTDEEEP